MADLAFRINPNIILGPYTISRLGAQVHEWGSRYMVIMDPMLNEAQLAGQIMQSLIDRKIESFVFAEPKGAGETLGYCPIGNHIRYHRRSR